MQNGVVHISVCKMQMCCTYIEWDRRDWPNSRSVKFV